MRLEKLILIALACSLLSACAEKSTESVTGSEPAAEPPPPVAQPAPPEAAPPDREALVTHMHLHAIYLKEVNTALAAGDLVAVETPAYWLSRHEAIDGLPQGWAPYVEGMRKEARAVEAATDVATAKEAAARLADNCRGCHEANGLDIELFARSGG